MNTENLWEGEFGDKYQLRNEGKYVNNLMFFSEALRKTNKIETLLEIGAGTGQNLDAIHTILPNVEMTAIEINESAAKKIKNANVINKSMFEPMHFIAPKCDLVLSKGFLIHVPPEQLNLVYNRMLVLARKYILIAEYYNPNPVEVEYHGEKGRMWKRDYAGELMEREKNLKLVDYGFVYHKDKWPQDDLTWFLLEKKYGC